MSKDELVSQLAVANKTVEELLEQDTDTRTSLSGFLGSYKTGMYDREPSIVTLDWAEIYFELGKIMERSKTFKSVEEMIEGHEHLQRSVNELQERVYQNENSGVK